MNAIAQVRSTDQKPSCLGPIFFWAVVRQSRSKGLFVWRAAYAGVLLVVLYLHFEAGRGVPAKVASTLAETAVDRYLMVQCLAVLILTPLFVAGALIGERQTQTLPLL